MKTRHRTQTRRTSSVAARRNLSVRRAVPSRTASSKNPNAVRPFRFKAPQAQLIDLRRRIKATKWPDRETVRDQSQGVPLATMQKLARYWATNYDWRKCEAKLNSRPQFMTRIYGLD